MKTTWRGKREELAGEERVTLIRTGSGACSGDAPVAWGRVRGDSCCRPDHDTHEGEPADVSKGMRTIDDERLDSFDS
jgi:hypothetical protein